MNTCSACPLLLPGPLLQLCKHILPSLGQLLENVRFLYLLLQLAEYVFFFPLWLLLLFCLRSAPPRERIKYPAPLRSPVLHWHLRPGRQYCPRRSSRPCLPFLHLQIFLVADISCGSQRPGNSNNDQRHDPHHGARMTVRILGVSSRIPLCKITVPVFVRIRLCRIGSQPVSVSIIPRIVPAGVQPEIPLPVIRHPVLVQVAGAVHQRIVLIAVFSQAAPCPVSITVIVRCASGCARILQAVGSVIAVPSIAASCPISVSIFILRALAGAAGMGSRISI